MATYNLRVNGDRHTVDVPGDLPLLWVLRDVLGYTGPKYGCGIGACRACTCHLDGQEFQPCITPVSAVQGRTITTIEGLADGDDLHPVQQAWIEIDVPACGYCQPGQIMTAAALLRTNRNPDDAAIDDIENLCRCGTYARLRQAIKRAAELMPAGGVRPAGDAVAAQGAADATNGQQDATLAAAVDQLPATGVTAGLGMAGAIAAAAVAAARTAADEDEAACDTGACGGACGPTADA